MARSPRRPPRDPDDWFAPEWEEAETLEQPLRRKEHPRATTGGRLPRGLLQRHPRRPRRGRYGALTAAATAAVVLILIGLAVSGAFTSSKQTPQPHPPTTTSARTATTPKRAHTPLALPTQPLSPGAHGSQVIRLQHALTLLGYLSAASDGAYGPKTAQALAAFQRHAGLTPDGILGPQTLHALHQALAQRK